MFYLALSCLQGRPMAAAAADLLALAPTGAIGLQLTPGCAPTPLDLSCETRTHHGFTLKALRTPVWRHGELVWQGDSVHPPMAREAPDGWRAPADVAASTIMETMYPGYADLSCGDELEAAMDAGRPLAVDVSHLAIQRHHGVASEATIARVLDYERVAEVHVSTSHEGRDNHARLQPETWGIDWAVERLRAGTPVILECYMHKLTHEERLAQVARFLP